MEAKPTLSRKYIFQLIDPNDGNPTLLERIYDMAQLVAIVLSLIPLAFREYTSFLATMEYCCVSLFIVDYLLRWSVADLVLNKGWRSFIIYPFTTMAIIDLLSILPTFNIIGEPFHLFRVTRLFKIFRLFKFGRYSKEIAILIEVLKK